MVERETPATSASSLGGRARPSVSSISTAARLGSAISAAAAATSTSPFALMSFMYPA
jgi:hypothetical protein